MRHFSSSLTLPPLSLPSLLLCFLRLCFVSPSPPQQPPPASTGCGYWERWRPGRSCPSSAPTSWACPSPPPSSGPGSSSAASSLPGFDFSSLFFFSSQEVDERRAHVRERVRACVRACVCRVMDRRRRSRSWAASGARAPRKPREVSVSTGAPVLDCWTGPDASRQMASS